MIALVIGSYSYQVDITRLREEIQAKEVRWLMLKIDFKSIFLTLLIDFQIQIRKEVSAKEVSFILS